MRTVTQHQAQMVAVLTHQPREALIRFQPGAVPASTKAEARTRRRTVQIQTVTSAQNMLRVGMYPEAAGIGLEYRKCRRMTAWSVLLKDHVHPAGIPEQPACTPPLRCPLCPLQGRSAIWTLALILLLSIRPVLSVIFLVLRGLPLGCRTSLQLPNHPHRYEVRH